MLDGLELPNTYHKQVKALLTYFEEHPEVYREIVSLAERIVKLKEEPEDSQQPEQVAKVYAQFLHAHPQLQQLLDLSTDPSAPLGKMLGDLVSVTASLSPSQQFLLQAAQSRVYRKAHSR